MTSQTIRQLARSAGLGKVLYYSVYTPRQVVNTFRTRGPVNVVLSAYGEAEMARRAAQLPPTPVDAPEGAPEVVFMTGASRWHQTCFCLYSLLRHAPRSFRVVIHDDDSLSPRQTDLLRARFPGIRFVRPAETEVNLDRVLPRDRYPNLRSLRVRKKHLRKLTDIFAGQPVRRLFLDSDMLFFRSPDFLLDWLARGDAPVYMEDIVSAYGYPAALMESLCGHPIPEKVNIGIWGLPPASLDWDRIEAWLGEFVKTAGLHYNITQALSAMHIAAGPRVCAPSHDYVVAPSREGTMTPKCVLQHYVAESKDWYFRYAWRHIASLPSRS
jgi:hypothetical protein